MAIDNLEDFLEISGICKADFEKSECNWEDLQSIAMHYEKNLPALQSAAELISSRVRAFKNVHSVRWRVKDTAHLLRKIVRKKLDVDANEKWKSISVGNYLEVVTDLIGVRALHLFKDECIEIDRSIRTTWDMPEVVVAYVRGGDSIEEEIKENGAVIKEHKSGYRSIHYIVKTAPEKLTFYAEVQVRTIFQEGWSEIDHVIRYPDYSDNEQIGVFLRLFSGLAGSADEMGAFVKDLNSVMRNSEMERAKLIREKEAAFSERDKALSDAATTLSALENLKQQDEESKKLIGDLKRDLDKLRSSRESLTPSEKLLLERERARVRNELLESFRNPYLGVSDMLSSSLREGKGVPSEFYEAMSLVKNRKRKV